MNLFLGEIEANHRILIKLGLSELAERDEIDMTFFECVVTSQESWQHS
jgi:hypothetical protein